MAEKTKIEWATHTFNPWIGCSKVHEGCAHCYAEAEWADRRGRVKWGPAGTRSLTKTWGDPLNWNRDADPNRGLQYGEKPRPRVFCASLADVFEDWQGPITDHRGNPLWRHPDDDHNQYYHAQAMNPEWTPLTMDDLRADLFHLIDATPNLDWLLLTKRPENIRRMTPLRTVAHPDGTAHAYSGRAFRPNLWLGTSVSTQESADRLIPELLRCRDLAAKLFVSAEPLLGPIDLQKYIGYNAARPKDPAISFCIIGGESGPKARPLDTEWVRELRWQCAQTGTACFIKQLGRHVLENDPVARCDWPGGTKFQLRDDETNSCRVLLRDPKGGDPDEWPEALRQRELPA